MHWLQLDPGFWSQGLEDSREVIRAVESCIVINLSQGRGGVTAHREEVVQQQRIWHQGIVAEDEWTKELESGHFNPLGVVLREPVKKLDYL